MIPYSLNKGVRLKVMVLLVLLSICLSQLFENTIIQKNIDYILQGNWLKNENSIEIFRIIIEFICPPFLIWSILYFAFSKICWKWQIVKKIHGIPDLNGIWKGCIVNDKNQTNRRNVTVRIKQDWNCITVRTYMDDTASERCIQSFCECTVAAIYICNGEAKLMYAYRNALLGSTSYIGYNELQIERDRIVGQYITTKISKGIFEIRKYKSTTCKK